MGKRTIRRAGLLGALCLPILPAFAQEIDALRMSFGVNQRFEFGDNLALETPEEGNSSISTTRLNFGLISETERQRLSFNLSGALTIQDTPDTDGTETDWGTPRMRLAYSRTGENASFGVTARYDVAFIDTLSLDDFVNDEGLVVLPEDFADLNGTGERTSYAADAFLNIGENAPLGFNLSAGASGIDYTGSVDPDLFDYDRTYAGARALFRVSPVLTGSAGLRYSTYVADDDAQTDTTRTTADVGVEYRISPRAVFNASIGLTDVNTEEFGDTTIDTTSPSGNIGFAYQVPDGSYSADYSATVDDDGNERQNLVFGRSLELPTGSLAATLGATDPEDGPVAPIGSLVWRQELPTGRITAQINRSVTSSNQDESSLTTLASLGYNRSINDVSGFGINVSYGESDATDTTGKVQRAGISATYSYELTEDWALNTGVNYRVRQEEGQDRSDSPSVFLSIGRSFDFRP